MAGKLSRKISIHRIDRGIGAVEGKEDRIIEKVEGNC